MSQLKHTIFCIAEHGIFEIIGTYEWSLSYFDFWCIWNNFFFKPSRHDTKDGDAPLHLLKNYFLEKPLLTSVVSAKENFATFSGKSDCLYRVNVLELQPTFLFKKGLLSEIISKVAVRKKCSLKWLFIWNISQMSGKPSVVECFC